jgi:predicted ferric reductase
MKPSQDELIETTQPAVKLTTVLIGMLGIAAGVILATQFLPAWLPGLSTSLLGPEPKAFWYLSRGSAIAAYLLLWLSMVFGLMITNRMARTWPGSPAAFELHEYVSLLGLAFAFFHGLILLGDQYIHLSLVRIAIPFGSSTYHPFWVGLGQIGFYIWILVVASFYVRRRIGAKSWRLIHFASYLAFAFALIHGITSGTDSSAIWTSVMYWLTGGTVLFMTIYRILVTKMKEPSRPQRVPQIAQE